MSDEPLAQLRLIAGRYEFVYPEMELIVRGPYVEWVLEAAAEIISRTEKLRAEGSKEELTILAEMGEPNCDMELDSLNFKTKTRFEAVPQCVVSMGCNDYRWVQKEGRDAPEHVYVERLADMSKTREGTNWLANET
ncbi:xanthine dehydrogenase iron-sulfur cluster and FAD-binding subunit A [Rhodoblastus acidophilus]|uniref:hypothetical protein n=1 Tax=Rhodoblastus acidophilus TaxID=1074 RepID=UPI002224E5EA|nr:hypothetical protein [Rhodoblastus acidophilus]MCW2319055.1 xanthine dehydrogenase iron-sulfur cluster and FAD-binding subunit A [Rhodoblastus acidophilus]